jgi:type I restriction enzyme R subunit
MTFNEPNTVEAHLRDLLEGAASTRLAPMATGLVCGGNQLVGTGCFRRVVSLVLLSAYRGQI